MDVEIKIDPALQKPCVIICTNALTAEISALAERLSASHPSMITAVSGGRIYLLDRKEIFRFYTEDQKTFVRCREQTYRVKHRLYELEDLLSGSSFVRISNSEIVNFSHVTSLDTSISGTISLRMTNGDKAFVSRRYVSRIKKYLGL
ncbi:LytTR family DNA-binding domain-containing protein [Eubacterium sp. 1001713B170207_170306_E7]|uniref:LytTR family DNA-binding domain-containing protein n=1 Tax=Eubacterium sp. 1001713B170207_170306_E7 TaxID=2787097 RepID=UPI001897A08D|nr:LytTR family DNA-binding domain-containing protein [Eubacterium sp. 1001713B170207_170306_E7]